MQTLLFYITYPIIWLASILPLRVLYIISDMFYLLIFYIIGYRKKVVLQNLKLAFPEKSDKEIKIIRKKFYKHFTDIFIESVKGFTISEKEILKRYTYKNPELANKIIENGKSVALVGAHLANWEWSITLPKVLSITVFGAYTKLANKHYEKVVKASRSRFGVIGYKTTDIIKQMTSNKKNNIQGLYILLSDQSPQVHKTHYWADFFGNRVPIHTGAEMLSKKFDFSVINYTTRKIKRGYYETEFTLITENAKEYENYQITDKYLQITEKAIKDNPEYYLWSHKRFKHMGKEPKKEAK